MPKGVYTRRPKPIADRFWPKTKKTRDGCVVWIGAVDPGTGYGMFGIGYRTHTAHRVALELRLGRPLKKGYWALHNCPKRRRHCVLHVYEGTQKQNMADRVKDGTNHTNQGTSNARARLTDAQVRAIKSAKRNRVVGTQVALARKYDVTPTAISSIWRGINWRHVEEKAGA